MRYLFRLSILFAVTCSSFIYGQDATQFLHPAIWLRADQTSPDSTFWQDVSGNHHKAFISPGQGMPGLSDLNYNPCFDFTGLISPFRVNCEMSGISGMTVLVVYQSADSANEKSIWSVTLDTSKTQGLSTQYIQGESFFVKYSDTNNTRPLVNTLGFTWMESPQDTAADFLLIGGNDTNAFRGKIAEFLLYPELLATKDLRILQSYLGIKYGVSLIGASYLNSAGNILWNAEENADFKYSIAGLGKDTTLRLDQRQSQSTGQPDMIILGAGAIDSLNRFNSYILSEGDFLIWGNNGASPVIDYQDSAMTSGPLERKWLMQVSGNTASQIPVAMQVDLSEQELDSLYCQLVIDRSAGNFTNFNDLEFIAPDSISAEKKAYFSHVFWDTDHSGKDLFTFYLMETTQSNSNRQVSEPLRENVMVNLDSTTGEGQIMADNPANAKQPAYFSQANRYSVFPNPTPGGYNLVIDLVHEGWIRITIRDLQQRVVREYSGDLLKSYHFDGRLEMPGTYYVDIRVEGERKVFPLIVR